MSYDEEKVIEIKSFFNKSHWIKKGDKFIHGDIEQTFLPDSYIEIPMRFEKEQTDDGKLILGNPSTIYIDKDVNRFYLPVLTKAEIEGTMLLRDKWYQQLVDWKTDVKKGKEEPVKSFFTKENDPFNADRNSTFDVLCIASVINKILFPPSIIEVQRADGTKRKKFVNQFSHRQLFYAMIAQKIPVIFGVQNKKSNYEIRIPINDDQSYKRIMSLTNKARYLGLISYDQIIDQRVARGVSPENPLMVRKSTDDKANIKLKLNFNVMDNFKPELEIPLIMLMSEKSETIPVFEDLADEYFLAYYSGAGYASDTGTWEVYKYIKQHAKIAIVLTVTDWDLAGMQMTPKIARDLQYYCAEDKNPPTIIVHRWLMGRKELEQLEYILKSEPTLSKCYTVNKQKVAYKIQELASLQMLVGQTGKLMNYENLSALYMSKLEELFASLHITIDRYNLKSYAVKGNYINISKPLLKRTEYQSLVEMQLDNVKKKIEDKLKDIKDVSNIQMQQIINSDLVIQHLSPIDWSGVKFDDYVQTLEKYILNSNIYKNLDKAVENSNIIPRDVKFKSKYKGKMGIFKDTIPEDKLIDVSKKDYKSVTKEIQKMKKNREDIDIDTEGSKECK